MDTEADAREKAFHGAVREYIICMLLFIGLYTLSYCIIRHIKKRSDTDDLYAGDSEDYLVYRIAVWICTFSMAVSIGAVLLLPFSIFSNEIVLMYPNSYYIQWLNSSLIHSLWNYIFFWSNLALFILLPFAYFFLESQGFSGLRKGIMTRVYETLAVCTLVIVVIVCLAHLISIVLDEERSRNQSLFNLWNYQLPFIYSCVSLFGVATLLSRLLWSATLVCTPLGVARLFTVTSQFVVRPMRRKDIEDKLYVSNLEEESLRLKLSRNGHNGFGLSNSWHGASNGCHERAGKQVDRQDLLQRLTELTNLKAELERQKRSLRWLQNLKYPVAMLLLLALTTIAILMVVNNTLQLLVGFRSLPSYTQFLELGNHSLSFLGVVGAAFEVMVIVYLMCASLVGFYSMPLLSRLKPVKGQTSMTKVIGNCAAVVILSSALPVLARTLGITSFDLLGLYGRIDWLRNFYLVCFYNAFFSVTAALCLVTKFTATVRRELCNRLNEAGESLRYRRLSSISLSKDT